MRVYLWDEEKPGQEMTAGSWSRSWGRVCLFSLSQASRDPGAARVNIRLLVSLVGGGGLKLAWEPSILISFWCKDVLYAGGDNKSLVSWHVYKEPSLFSGGGLLDYAQGRS